MDIRQFDIEIFSLKFGTHRYQFSIGDSFWSHFDYGLINKGSAKVALTLEKSETLLQLDLRIHGSLELECDRSLDKFDYPFDVRRILVFKYGENEGELGEDVYVIHPSTSTINISQHLYEFIALEVPIKKLHPRYQGDPAEESDELFYRDPAEAERNSESSDPRWETLKKLRHDN